MSNKDTHSAKSDNKINSSKANYLKRNKYYVAFGIFIVAIITAITIGAIRQYVISQAEKRIQVVLQKAEALHYYVQEEMLPTMYELKAEGRVPEEFYSPQILSSSYITKRVFEHYNLIRKSNNQPLIEYRMASKNPRNKINQADSLEASLIDLFNRDSLIKKQIGIINLHGENHLYYAKPFLKIKQQCLKCHGSREDAPANLRDYYHWDSGFNLKVGDIPAVEIIKTPIKTEYNTIVKTGAVVLLFAVLFIILMLLYANLLAKKALISKQNEEIEKSIKKLKQAQTHLVQSEKMASLGTLTAGVAHEINNPLNFIQGGYAGIEKLFDTELKEKKPKVEKMLNAINVGISRTLKIVSGLNQLSSNSKNNEPCHVNAIIDNCLLILKNELPNKVLVTNKRKTDKLIVFGNKGDLHQMFINIFTNAKQAVANNGNIDISMYRKNSYAVIEISDNGTGIEQKHLSRITEPFFTTKSPNVGTGLGLSISYNIIKNHGGMLNITSEVNKGTKVQIKLPEYHE